MKGYSLQVPKPRSIEARPILVAIEMRQSSFPYAAKQVCPYACYRGPTLSWSGRWPPNPDKERKAMVSRLMEDVRDRSELTDALH